IRLLFQTEISGGIQNNPQENTELSNLEASIRHSSPEMSFQAVASSEFSLLNPLPRLWVNLVETGQLQLEVPDVHKWMAQLPVRHRVLPAPINAMSGGFKIEINSQGNSSESQFSTQTQFSINMEGTGQALELNTQANLNWNPLSEDQ